MKKLIVIVLLCTLQADARIGWSFETCQKAFGVPQEDSKVDHYRSSTFKSDGLWFMYTFRNDKCIMFTIHNPNNKYTKVSAFKSSKIAFLKEEKYKVDKKNPNLFRSSKHAMLIDGHNLSFSILDLPKDTDVYIPKLSKKKKD